MIGINETLAEREAALLVARLYGRDIELWLDGNRQVKWTTNRVDGLTLTDIRAIKRLTPELRALLDLCGGFDRAIDDYLENRNGGAA